MALRAVNSGGPAQEDSEGNSGSNWARDSSCDFGKHVFASCMLVSTVTSKCIWCAPEVCVGVTPTSWDSNVGRKSVVL